MMRYYYADPLAAAWMSKNFGMRFSIPGYYHKEEIYDLKHGWDKKISGGHNDPDEDIYIIRSSECYMGKFDRAYIHPDSEYILKPQNGDLGIDDEGDPYFWSERSKSWIGYHEASTKRRADIIRRGDVAFITPMKEMTPNDSTQQKETGQTQGAS